MELYIVLAIMAFMIVGFVWNKWPFGLTAMTCCVLLALTNVYPIDKAFAGFTNKNVILVAPMFVLSAAFGRTSLLRKIQDKMVVLKGKSGFVLLVALYAVVIALACFLPTTAEMTLMLMFLVSLGNTGDITPSRMTIPILGMLSMWAPSSPLVWAQPLTLLIMFIMRAWSPTKASSWASWTSSKLPSSPASLLPSTACLLIN